MQRSFIIYIFAIILLGSCKQTKLAVDRPAMDADLMQLEYENRLINATKYKLLGYYEKAKDELYKSLKLKPKSAASWYSLADIYQVENEMDSAYAAIGIANTYNPLNKWYKVFELQLCMQTGRYERADALFTELIKLDSKHLDLQLQYAQFLGQQTEYQRSIGILNQLESKDFEYETVIRLKNEQFLQLQKMDSVYAGLQKLIKYKPDDYRNYGLLAEYYLSQQLYDSALSIYELIENKGLDNSATYLSKANYYRIKGDNNKQLETLQHALDDNSVELERIYDYLTRISPNLKLDESKYPRILQQIFDIDSTHYVPNQLYYEYYTTSGEYHKARLFLLKTLEAKPDNLNAWVDLISLDIELYRYDYMDTDAGEAISYFPNQPLFYLYKGMANLRLKNYDKAIKLLKNGKFLVAGDAELVQQFDVNLGEAYFKVKEYAKSDAAYESVLENDPDNYLVLNNYAYYLALRGDRLERALKMAKKCVDYAPANLTYLDTYAWTLYKSAIYDQAKIFIDKALENGGRSQAIIVEHAGDIYYKNQKYIEALNLYQQVLDLDRNTTELQQKILKIKEILNNE